MNQLIAKLRDRNRKDSKYRKIISGEDFFTPLAINNGTEYNPSTLLDEDEWFIIRDFSQQDYCLDILQTTLNSVDYTMFSMKDFDKLDFICSFQKNGAYFQNISKAQLICKKRLYFGEQCRYIKNSTSIVIHDYPDAFYCVSDDVLFFKKISSISSIFRGVDQLYREATDTETQNFLGSDFICLSDDFTADDVKKANRRRIALTFDTLNSLPEMDKIKLFDYIKDYCPGLWRKDDKLPDNSRTFLISSEPDLKLLLFGIEQRYYTTHVGDEKRIANSIIPLHEEV